MNTKEKVKKIKNRICSFIEKYLKSILIFLFLLFGWFIFENKLMNLFNECIIPVLSMKEFSEMSNIYIYSSLFIVILVSIYYVGKIKTYRYRISFLTMLILSCFVFLYEKYRFFGLGNINYTAVPNVFWIFGYTDVLIFILCVFLILFWYFFFCSKETIVDYNKNNFLPDLPINGEEEDELDYKESANKLARYLKSIDPTSSCSIGLIAPWGTGKTSYMNLVKNSLLKDKNEFIVAQFNPRHSLSSQNIQEDFFEILSSKLKKYNSTIKSDFAGYLRAINIYADSKVISTFLGIQKLWDKESKKEKISNAIKKTGKRIVVFIDDFDRLLVEEIIEIFKLIDGNASFSNMIFITAYDKKQINELIKKEYHNDDTFFSDKFFTMEIQIPLRPYRKVYEYLLQKLFIGLDENENLYRATLNKRIDLLEKYLPTLRDVKRFLNLFIRQYKYIEKEIDFECFFLLYLIKYRYLDEYLALYKKENAEGNSCFSVDSNQFVINEKGTEKLHSRQILELLFAESQKKTHRSINNKLAFNIYFHERLYTNLPVSKMERVFNSSLRYAKLFIDNSVEQGMFKDLLEYLESRNILNFKNEVNFERYLNLLIYINCKGYDIRVPLDTIYRLLYIDNYGDISVKYLYLENEYKNAILNKLQGKYPDYPYNINQSIITELINDNSFKEKIIFAKEEILDIAKSALKDLIANEQTITQKHINMLGSCISDIENDIITLDKEACSTMRKAIEANPAGYFKEFVCLGGWTSNPEWNSITCGQYWDQIFGSINDLESFIRINQSKIPNISLINNFLELYKNNDYKPIEFNRQGNVQEKINNNLGVEIKNLHTLLDMERQFDELEKNRSKVLRKKESEVYLKKYNDFLNSIEKNRLYIAKRYEIIQKINTVIQLIKIFPKFIN